MIFFGLLGALAMVLIALIVKPFFTETFSEARDDPHEATSGPGAPRLLNRNTVLLTTMSLIGGLVIYGYLGMYPTFLREGLHYTPTAAGRVVGGFGLGALGSLGGGWPGDRFSAPDVLEAAFPSPTAFLYRDLH